MVVLCEGDPFFYGSFMHLHSRLQGRAEVEVVPGITGMSGCWTATGMPITWGDDVLTVLMGTLPEEELGGTCARCRRAGGDEDRPQPAEAAPRACQAPGGSVPPGWSNAARCRANACSVCPRPSEVTPYFSIVLVHGQGRRP